MQSLRSITKRSPPTINCGADLNTLGSINAVRSRRGRHIFGNKVDGSLWRHRSSAGNSDRELPPVGADFASLFAAPYGDLHADRAVRRTSKHLQSGEERRNLGRSDRAILCPPLAAFGRAGEEFAELRELIRLVRPAWRSPDPYESSPANRKLFRR